MKETPLVLKCPQCGEEAKIIQETKDIPKYGKILISTIVCDKCNFRITDVMNIDMKPPARYTIKIESSNDLSSKIIRSSTGTIKIPELGLDVEPGAIADGYITNIEGMLERFKAAVKVMQDTKEQENKEIVNEIMNEIELAQKGELVFTVIIEDPLGNSAILGEKALKELLNEEEVNKLKQHLNIFEIKK